MMYKLTDEQIAEVRKLYPRKQTNFESIKAMSLEELAEFLYVVTDCCANEDCLSCPMHKPCCYCDHSGDVEDWLKRGVEE